MNIIITMAGEGSRFKKVGYSQPKYEIQVAGKTLFSWAMKSLDNFRSEEDQLVFIARKSDASNAFIDRECLSLEIRKYTILEIDYLTDGQATTAVLARSVISDKALPIAIYNIDTYVEPQCLNADKIRGDGWLPCFPGTGDQWSFARANSDGRVIEVREKQRVSPHATIGLYWFSSFDLYLDSYDRFYSDLQNLEKGERYVAPLYNHMIKDGLDVYIDNIPFEAVSGLGTPEEVLQFARSQVDC